MSKFKVGDKVRRTNYYNNDYLVKGKAYTIESISKGGFLMLEGVATTGGWLDDYFELVTEEFKRGERVLVSDNNVRWVERIYLATIDGAEQPIFAVSGVGNWEKHFEKEEKFNPIAWRYIKKLSQKQTVTLTPKEAIEKLKEKYGSDVEILIK